MVATARSILQTPLVLFAAVVELLRRIPGYRQMEARAAVVVVALMIIAVVLLGVWMAQRSPQRVSMAQLVRGDVSAMQSWLIISGDVRQEQSTSAVQRFVLTDPNVANARLTIFSDVPIPNGRGTVSGTLIGGSRGSQADFLWLGQLQADSMLAREPDPPWAAMLLAGVALFHGLGSRSAYPTFFRQKPRPAESVPATVKVGVRQEWPPFTEEPAVGSLTFASGQPVSLSLPGQEARVLRLHSARSGVETGELRRLLRSEPAMLVRPTGGELTLTFATASERDAALALLTADARTVARGPA